MHRRIIYIIIIVCIVFTGCEVLNPERKYEKVIKKLSKLTTYTCDVIMKVTNNRSTMEYKLKHYYKSPDKYRIEVISPKELEGQTTIYNGRSSYIYHPGINQYLVTENFSDSMEYNAFAGSFMEHIRKTDGIKISNEKLENKEFIILEFEVSEPNSYMSLEKLWIDADLIVPVKAEIYGDDGRISVELYYDNFIYNISLKDEDFEIIQKN